MFQEYLYEDREEAIPHPQVANLLIGYCLFELSLESYDSKGY